AEARAPADRAAGLRSLRPRRVQGRGEGAHRGRGAEEGRGPGDHHDRGSAAGRGPGDRPDGGAAREPREERRGAFEGQGGRGAQAREARGRTGRAREKGGEEVAPGRRRCTSTASATSSGCSIFPAARSTAW